MSVVEERVARAIEAYLGGSLDLDGLQDVLIEATWDNPDAPELALEAELLVAEMTSGHRSNNDLRDALAGALRKAQAQYA